MLFRSGSPVSPVLANLFLHELDVLISASDQHIVRYADDFLVLSPRPEGAGLMIMGTWWWLAPPAPSGRGSG